MCGGPRVPVWLDLREDWPEGDVEEEGEVCTQSSFILLRSTTSESLVKLRLELLFADSLCSLFQPVPLFPSLSCATPPTLYGYPAPSQTLSLAYPPSQYHSAEWVPCKLGGLLPPAVDVSGTPHSPPPL